MFIVATVLAALLVLCAAWFWITVRRMSARLRMEQSARAKEQLEAEQLRRRMQLRFDHKIARMENLLAVRLAESRTTARKQQDQAVHQAIELADAVHEVDLRQARLKATEACRRQQQRDLLIKMEEGNAQARAHLKKNEVGEAQLKLFEVLGLALATGLPQGEACACHHLALALAQTDLAMALRFMSRAIAIGEVHSLDAERVEQYRRHLKELQTMAFNQQAQELHRAAKALLHNGQHEQSAQLFRQAASLAERAENPALQISIAIDSGSAYSEQPEQGLVELRNARKLLGNLEAEQANILGGMLSDQILFLEDLSVSREFRRLMSEVLQQYSQGHLDLAQAVAREAYEEAGRAYGASHYKAATALDAIGVCLFRQGRAESALPYFEHAFQVAREWPDSAQGTLETVARHRKVCRQFLGYEPPEESQ